MRNLLFLVAASLLLAGCLRNERGEFLGRSEFYRTSEKAQSLGLLTPAIAEECSAHTLKRFREGTRIAGPFSLSTDAAIFASNDRLLMNGPGDNTVAVLAPVNAIGLLGEVRWMAGCLYRLEDNRLVFLEARTFGKRIDGVRPGKARRSGSE